jgi:hypothetical protein
MVGSDGLPILPSEVFASHETQQSQMMQHIILLAKEAKEPTRKSQTTQSAEKVSRSPHEYPANVGELHSTETLNGMPAVKRRDDVVEMELVEHGIDRQGVKVDGCLKVGLLDAGSRQIQGWVDAEYDSGSSSGAETPPSDGEGQISGPTGQRRKSISPTALPPWEGLWEFESGSASSSSSGVPPTPPDSDAETPSWTLRTTPQRRRGRKLRSDEIRVSVCER